jgi:RNA polymerase sigma factor (sigma-70 family)
LSIVNAITCLLNAAEQGDPTAASQLLPLVYDELRRLAAQRLAQEKPGQTLEATALVHEAYLRLVANSPALEPGDADPAQVPGYLRQGTAWHGRGHFFAAAAEAMRRILVENGRRKKRQKRGGSLKRVELVDAQAPSTDDKLLALDEALTNLAEEDPVAARVIELHHFAGASHEDVAVALGITVYQARQKWTYARAWLSNALR